MMDKNKIAGYWRIIDMETWDQKFVDLVIPGYFKFDTSGHGSFQFICVEGDIDYKISNKLEFCWSGNDEYNAASGRGWVKLKNDNEIHGKIYIQSGDSSSFVAIRQQE